MYNVLVVDDSAVARSLISQALSGAGEFRVAGSVANGMRALESLEKLSCDIAIVDLEMPQMNGLELLARLNQEKNPIKVIIFAAATKSSALSALQGLNRGAFDFVLKPNGGSDPLGAIREVLLPKLRAAAQAISQSAPQHVQTQWTPAAVPARDPRAIVIGSSTGGPTALEKVFTQIDLALDVPIFIVQHMPPVFTAALAERLSGVSGLDVREGQHQEEVMPGRVYIAPGDYHMRVEKTGGKNIIMLNQTAQRHSVRPAVDYLFESAAEVYREDLLGIVLTGMGQDGCEGAVKIKRTGGRVWIQSPETCVVYGMPRAVFEARAYDRQLPLLEIRESLKSLLERGQMKRKAHAL